MPQSFCAVVGVRQRSVFRQVARASDQTRAGRQGGDRRAENRGGGSRGGGGGVDLRAHGRHARDGSQREQRTWRGRTIGYSATGRQSALAGVESDANNKAVFRITIASGDMDTVKGRAGGALLANFTVIRGESGRGEHGDGGTRAPRRPRNPSASFDARRARATGSREPSRARGTRAGAESSGCWTVTNERRDSRARG